MNPKCPLFTTYLKHFNCNTRKKLVTKVLKDALFNHFSKFYGMEFSLILPKKL